jgi:hypothetical protein
MSIKQMTTTVDRMGLTLLNALVIVGLPLTVIGLFTQSF